MQQSGLVGSRELAAAYLVPQTLIGQVHAAGWAAFMRVMPAWSRKRAHAMDEL